MCLYCFLVLDYTHLCRSIYLRGIPLKGLPTIFCRHVSFIIHMFATIDSTLFLILFMFLVIMFIVYVDYMLSIARLLLYSSISSYSTRPNAHGVSGRCCVSVVLICCLLVDAPYIPGHVVDRGCDTPIESFVVHSPNIGQVGSSYEGRHALFLIFHYYRKSIHHWDLHQWF